MEAITPHQCAHAACCCCCTIPARAAASCPAAAAAPCCSADGRAGESVAWASAAPEVANTALAASAMCLSVGGGAKAEEGDPTKVAAHARLTSGTAGLAAGRMTRGEGLRGGVEGEEMLRLAASGEDGMAGMIFTGTSTPSGTHLLGPLEESGAGAVDTAATAAAAALVTAAEPERDCEGVTGAGTGALAEAPPWGLPPIPPFFSASACIFAAREFFHARGEGQWRRGGLSEPPSCRCTSLS